MKQSTTKFYNWATEKALSPKAPLWLTLLFSLELVLFIPLDAVLVFFCMQNRKKTLLYILLAALASTASALVGYFFGHFLWDLVQDYIVPTLISKGTFQKMSTRFELYNTYAAFFGSLLPLPLKALSLVAGVFHIGAASFASAVVAARILRFALVGSLVAIFGDKVKTFIDKHFHKIILALAAKAALIALVVYSIL